jgi:hypothetical protein
VVGINVGGPSVRPHIPLLGGSGEAPCPALTASHIPPAYLANETMVTTFDMEVLKRVDSVEAIKPRSGLKTRRTIRRGLCCTKKSATQSGMLMSTTPAYGNHG